MTLSPPAFRFPKDTSRRSIVLPSQGHCIQINYLLAETRVGEVAVFKLGSAAVLGAKGIR